MNAIIRPTLKVRTTLVLNEEETQALYAITVYGEKNFLEVFYKHLGRHYLEPHEKGLISLFEKAKLLDSVLNEINKKRKDLPKSISI